MISEAALDCNQLVLGNSINSNFKKTINLDPFIRCHLSTIESGSTNKG